MSSVLTFLIILIMGSFTILNAGTLAGEIRVSHPDNIQFLMEKFKAGFETANPEVQIILQSGPNVQQVSQIASGKKSADVIVVSDDRIAKPQLEGSYLDKPIEFMTDEIALIAGKNAKHFDDLQIKTWHLFLLRPEVKVLIPDAANSYAGNRVPLVWKLAETWVHEMMLYEKMKSKLDTTHISPSPVKSLLSGQADYAFDYATQAKQNGLRLFRLVKYYNLGDPTLANVYKGVAIEIENDNEKSLLYGEPIIYSIGQLKGSGNNSAAKAFVDFVVSEEGRAILEQQELTAIK